MNISQALRAITSYPTPSIVIEKACLVGGLDAFLEVDPSVFKELEYMKAERHVLEYLLIAPSSISEQGVSFSIGQDEKSTIRERLSDLQKSIERAELASSEISTTQKRNKVVFYRS